MPGLNLTRDEAAERADLLDVATYDIYARPDDVRGHLRLHDRHHVLLFRARRLHLRRPGRRRPCTRSPSTASAIDPSAYADNRIALTDLQADNELRVVADCAYSRTGEGLHRFVDPVDKRGLPLHAVRGRRTPAACSPASSSPTSRRRSRSTSPRRRTGRSSPTRPTPEPVAGGDSASSVWHFEPTKPHVDLHHRARRRRLRRGARHATSGTRGEIPLGVFCRAVAARAPRRRRHLRGHQAGLRVLRGRLRHGLPVRQVRPAVRAGVQHGRDGERRLRDLPRRRTSSAAAVTDAAVRAAAPTRSCTRWRTCGSATSSR